MRPDEHAILFERWLADYGAVLHHVSHGFAEGADREDLMQELLLALWKAIPAYRHDAQPSTFIYRVAHNTALTWKRTQRNYRTRIEQMETQAQALPVMEGQRERERETLELVYAHIRRLPPVDRSLILLHLDGMSYAEMAYIHGLSERNVGVRLTRLKQKLTKSMKALTDELR